MEQLWGKALETLITRSPELGFGVVALYVLWRLTQSFLAHLTTHEAGRRADQAVCHQHQERMTDRMETAFEHVAGVVEKNTAALARVEVRLDEHQQPPRKESP